MKRLVITVAMFAAGAGSFLLPTQAEAQSGTASGAWTDSERIACTTAHNAARNTTRAECGRNGRYSTGECDCTYDGDRPEGQRYGCDVSWSCDSSDFALWIVAPPETCDGGKRIASKDGDVLVLAAALAVTAAVEGQPLLSH